jgi:hypothetical protein
MKLIEKIKADRIVAMKNQDKDTRLSLSTLIGELDRKFLKSGKK